MNDKLCNETEGRLILGNPGKTKYWEILNEIARTEPSGVKKIGRLTKPKLSALLNYIERCPNYEPSHSASAGA
ncbi:MAG: hypothetical protein L6Q57_08840 [Alphaproteobacteria bacterium]|nr:hypothetical protein [Alphaproteobacteria bacterium]